MNPSPYPCLWFDGKAQEAAQFYCSVFKNAKILDQSPLVVNLEINNQRFMLLNGGSMFTFNESVSFVVDCDTQKEIDNYWQKLTADGGEESMCGWLKDKYGLSWQIVPSILPEIMQDPERAKRVADAFMKMKKLDIETLTKA